MSGTLLKFGQDEPKAGAWLALLGDTVDRMAREGPPADLILLAPAFWYSFRILRGDLPLEEFRGIRVLRDNDCPSVWVGSGPMTATMIPLGEVAPSMTIKPPSKLDIPYAAIRLQDIRREVGLLADSLNCCARTRHISRRLIEIVREP